MNTFAFNRFLALSGQVGRPQINTADTTVGAATLTAAAIAGGMITRSGSTAAYTDTTATAQLILNALPIPTTTAQSWFLFIRNTVAFTETLTGGTGVTLSGVTTTPPLSVGVFLVTYSAAGAVTMVGLGSFPICNLPAAKFVTGTAATFAAGDLTGAASVAYTNTGNNATITVRTGTQMFGDTPNAQVGMSWLLLIRNEHATTATITADGGATVTLTGTMTIAQNVTRTFIATFTSASAATLQSVGISAAGA